MKQAKSKPSFWKGKKLSEEHCRKLSNAHKDIPNNWLGRKHSEESKLKMSQTRKKMFSENPELKEKISNDVKKLWKDNIYREKMTGENASNWKGGITPKNKLLRTQVGWSKWRNQVFKRDNYTCQNINCDCCNNKLGGTLHPHHIKHVATNPELIYDVNNGITYCENYHLKSGLHKVKID